jgi:hypothetical protein
MYIQLLINYFVHIFFLSETFLRRALLNTELEVFLLPIHVQIIQKNVQQFRDENRCELLAQASYPCYCPFLPNHLAILQLREPIQARHGLRTILLSSSKSCRGCRDECYPPSGSCHAPMAFSDRTARQDWTSSWLDNLMEVSNLANFHIDAYPVARIVEIFMCLASITEMQRLHQGVVRLLHHANFTFVSLNGLCSLFFRLCLPLT